MTFEECNQLIESITPRTIGWVNEDGKAIEKIIPMPTDIKDDELVEWMALFWPQILVYSRRPIDEWRKMYQDFSVAYLFLLAKDDPTSVRPQWVEIDFPRLLNKE